MKKLSVRDRDRMAANVADKFIRNDSVMKELASTWWGRIALRVAMRRLGWRLQ